METADKIIRILLLIALAIPPLYAQDLERSSSYIVRTDEGLRIFQRIVFPQIPDTIRYEVEVERIERNVSVPITQITVTVNRFEVSLRAGLYRYRYSAINRMGILEGRSEWEEFEIFESIQPFIESYQPLFADTENSNGTLVIQGMDFFQESEFALVSTNPDFNWTGVNLNGRNDVILPSHVIVENDTASLDFSRELLVTGSYEIFIRNPGGLWICSGEIIIDTSVSAAHGLVSVTPPEHGERNAVSRLIENEESPHTGLHKLQSINSNRYNALGFALGASFPEPLTFGSLNIAVSLWENLFGEFGFDLGSMSINNNVNEFTSVYLYINLGYFLPFTGKGGLLFGAGGGLLKNFYEFDSGSTVSSLFAANVFAGINIGNAFNIIYSLRSDFSSINHKLSFGYIFRFE